MVLIFDLLVRWLEKTQNIPTKWWFNGDESHGRIRKKHLKQTQVFWLIKNNGVFPGILPLYTYCEGKDAATSLYLGKLLQFINLN